MRDERSPSDDDAEVFPAGEEAPNEGESSGGEETFPAGVEADELERPGEKLEDGQPGMLEDPPRAD